MPICRHFPSPRPRDVLPFCCPSERQVCLQRQRYLPICRQFTRTGATGLEPATSGVTDRYRLNPWGSETLSVAGGIQFISSIRRKTRFRGEVGVDQPRPTLRGRTGESSAFDVDPADLVFARARAKLYVGGSDTSRAEERVTSRGKRLIGSQAACSYSWIRPPSRFRRLSCGKGGARSGTGFPSARSGGRSASARCGRWSLSWRA